MKESEPVVASAHQLQNNIVIKKYLTRFEKYGLERVFDFEYPDYYFVLVGYPIWRAYVVSKKISFNLEVTPEVNLRNRTISFPYDMVLYDDDNNRIEQKKEIIDASDLEIKGKINLFFEMIPKDVADAVSVYNDSHWEIVNAIIQYGEKLLVMVKSKPALGYITINMNRLNGSFNTSNNMDYIERILLNKQKEIMELARLIGTQRIVKAIVKLDLELLNIKNLIALRNSLFISREIRDRVLELISHEKKIGRGLFQIIGLNPQLLRILTNRAVLEISLSMDREEIIKKLDRVCQLFEGLEIKEPFINSISILRNIEDKVEKELIKSRGYGIKFPEPPIPGEEQIIPIQSKGELKAWSKRQSNCVHGYTTKILKKRVYIYKVIHGLEEATLELRITKAGIKIGEFKGKSNQSVSLGMRVMVDEWISNYYIRL